MIGERIREIRGMLPEGCELVAVSKFHPAEMIREAYDAGQRVFGESHAQELVRKVGVLPEDIEWHFIGHLQTNKVKMVVPHVRLIHSVDSVHLLKEIDRQAVRLGRRVDCLLQLHIAQEMTKFGFAEEELPGVMELLPELSGVRVRGLMCMATNSDDTELVRGEFRRARGIFDDIRGRFFAGDEAFGVMSMGMSDDFRIAVCEGSTMVRVGSLIFGERVYD